MSRKLNAVKREILPDRKYGSVPVSKFINCLMKQGKKSTAERIFYGAMEIITTKLPDNESVVVFNQALENVKPPA